MKNAAIRLWKLARTREFLVCIITYPLLAVSVPMLLRLFGAASERVVLFGCMSFCTAALIVVLSVWEIVGRLLKHGRQGKHLEIRRRSGVNIHGRD